jgi:hypothetical protein
MTRRRRSQVGLVLAGAVVIAAGLAIGLVELLRYPKGSLWVIVAVAAGLIALIMKLRGSA